jgi:putative ABC transport system permease protein
MPSPFEKKLLPVYDKYLASIFSQFNIKMRFSVQPIASIHLHSTMNNEPEELGSTSYIYIFSAVAFFMLLIACINYMNLTTARSARRSKEIGIRKVTGSSKLQLVAQFLIESTLTARFRPAAQYWQQLRCSYPHLIHYPGKFISSIH